MSSERIIMKYHIKFWLTFCIHIYVKKKVFLPRYISWKMLGNHHKYFHQCKIGGSLKLLDKSGIQVFSQIWVKMSTLLAYWFYLLVFFYAMQHWPVHLIGTCISLLACSNDVQHEINACSLQLMYICCSFCSSSKYVIIYVMYVTKNYSFLYTFGQKLYH